jgi:hypothetical protein
MNMILVVSYLLLVKTYKSIILFLPLFFFLTTNSLQPTTIFAQEMRSQNFIINGGNFNMTSGNKSSAQFKLSDVVGQTAAGTFTSKGFILNTGFLNGAAGEVFSFSVTPSTIDFGELIPNTPIEKTLRLTISNGNVPGYTVTGSENQSLSTTVGAEIVDTACDTGSNCTNTNANKWDLNTTYGFGYRITGRTVPTDFKKENYYRPFPGTIRNEKAVIMMQSKAKKVVDQATMTLRLNTGRQQPVGQYQNVLSFTAIAGI